MKRVIRIEGAEVEPVSGDVLETEPGVYSILVDGKSYEARLAGAEIVIEGRRFDFEIEDPRAWKRAGGASAGHVRAVIAAPMPGRVVRILVSVDEQVAAGQGIVVVEAMKMQNEMKAPRAGRVSSISVRENDSVNAGAVLAAIE